LGALYAFLGAAIGSVVTVFASFALISRSSKRSLIETVFIKRLELYQEIIEFGDQLVTYCFLGKTPFTGMEQAGILSDIEVDPIV